ncbi:MAG: serine/threonine-protein kinase, partial [Nocardioides sp.]
MTATPSLPEPGERFAGYEIRAELGRGAMGAVYRADQDTPRRQVALKVLLPTQTGDQDGRERFDREIDALVAADSPHIVAIYDHGEDRGFRYLAMQLVTEGDLASLLKAGPLPPAEAIELARQVCLGLADAHAAGVLHRDVKPSNVLVRSRPSGRHAYLCDFGIASRSASSAGDATDALTEEGEVVGTWAYLPPERCRGGAATPQGDVYAAGCLLWTMLTGAAPYGTDSVAAALGHLNGTIPQLPSTGPLAVGLNEVWRIALAKDPDDRYAGAAEMATALAALPAA